MKWLKKWFNPHEVMTDEEYIAAHLQSLKDLGITHVVEWKKVGTIAQMVTIPIERAFTVEATALALQTR